jgi:hypothetical protein
VRAEAGTGPARAAAVTAGDCGQIRPVLGVYLLGAIDPAGRTLVDRHLAGCRSCREDLAGLAGLPALLGRVPDAEAYALARHEAGWDSYGDLPPETLARLLGQAVRIRRQRRWRGIAAAVAAVVVLVSGCVAANRVLHPAGSQSHASGQVAWTAVSASNSRTRASATVSYAPQLWGIKLDVRIRGIPAGTVCQIWTTNSRGQETPAGSWTVARGYPGAWYPAAASVPISGVRAFVISAAGKTLVTVPVRSR